MSEAHLLLRSNDRCVRLTTLQENIVEAHRAFAAFDIVEVVSTKSSITKETNLSGGEIMIPKEMKVLACLTAPASWKDIQDKVSKTLVIVSEDCMNTTQVHKSS